jgi:hypothetical protein
MTAIQAHLVTLVAVVTKTTTTVADSASLKAVATNARAVLTTDLRVPLRLAVTSVAVTTAVALPVATSAHLAVTSAVVMTAVLPVVISAPPAVTSVPVSQPLVSPWAPSQVTAEKYLCLVTLQSAPHVLHVNSSSAT